jgi:hypothetical protein
MYAEKSKQENSQLRESCSNLGSDEMLMRRQKAKSCKKTEKGTCQITQQGVNKLLGGSG